MRRSEFGSENRTFPFKKQFYASFWTVFSSLTLGYLEELKSLTTNEDDAKSSIYCDKPSSEGKDES